MDAAPNLEPVVCGCVEKRIQADRYLGWLYTLPLASFREKIDEGKFKSYFFGKMVSFLMACAAPEIERIVDSIDPEKGLTHKN